MEQAEAKLREPVAKKQTLEPPLLGHAELSSALDRLSLEPVRLTGSPNQQIQIVLKAQESKC